MVTDVLIDALENLIKAVKDEHKVSIDIAVSDAISALGYDPSYPEQEYLVSLEIGVTSTNPEAAVREFIELLKNNPDCDWVYKTINENDEEEIVDSYRWVK